MSYEPIDQTVLNRIRPRPEVSHKGTFGTLAALCGSEYMPGAAYLSAMGALRSGVGLLKLAVPNGILPVLQSRLAEPVWIDPESLPDPDATAFLCGPGLGRSSDALLDRLLPQIRCPAVYDADCINYFALHKDKKDRFSDQTVFTPHAAEFSRLTGIPIGEIQKDRVKAASEYAVSHGCVLVLKGHGSVVALPDGRIRVNTSGCNALSKGGSGDVLAGLIGSLLAQGYSAEDAACIGVYVHGLAGERLAERFGAHGALPSDLPAEIGRILG